MKLVVVVVVQLKIMCYWPWQELWSEAGQIGQPAGHLNVTGIVYRNDLKDTTKHLLHQQSIKTHTRLGHRGSRVLTSAYVTSLYYRMLEIWCILIYINILALPLVISPTISIYNCNNRLVARESSKM